MGEPGVLKGNVDSYDPDADATLTPEEKQSLRAPELLDTNLDLLLFEYIATFNFERNDIDARLDANGEDRPPDLGSDGVRTPLGKRS